MEFRKWLLLLLLLGGTALGWSQGVDESLKPVTRTFALKNATVVVKPGQTIQNATVVVKNGLIQAVGQNIPVPADARVIAADSMFIYAGFIDGLSYAGIPVKREDPAAAAAAMRQRAANSGNPTNEQAGIQPEIKVRDVISAQEKSIEDLRKLGFTAAHVVPQGRMLPGSGAVVLLNGKTADDMVIKDNTSLFATLDGARGVYPSTVIAVMSKFRELYKQAEQLKAHEAAYAANPAGLTRPEINRSLQAFYPVIDKKQPVFFAAPDVKSMYRVMTLQQELGFPLVLSGVKQSWHVADMIKAKNVPVLVSVDLPKAKEAPKAPEKKEGQQAKKDPEMEKLEARAAAEMKSLESQAATLAGKGVSFGFASFNGKPAELRDNLRRMIKNGLTEDQALAALTTTPANMFGLSQNLGTVEKGKLANLVVSDKPYFAEKSNVRYVMVNGSLFEYEAPKTGPEKKADPNAKITVAGSWSYRIDAPGNETQGTMTFNENGSDISGSWSAVNMPGSQSIQNATLKGNALTFTTVVDMGGQALQLDFNLTIDGNSFSGKVKAGDFGSFDVTGKRDGNPR